MKLVRIIKPGKDGEPDLVAVVPESSLPHHFRAGWARLDESPEPEPEPDPAPVRRGRKAAAAAADDTSKQEGE